MRKKVFGTYIITISALLAVIAAAVFLPQFIFYVQDSYQVNQVDVINRDVYDIMEMQTAYSADTTTRLKKLADVGYGNVTVSLVDNSIGYDEFYNIISEVRNSEYVSKLVSMTYDELDAAIGIIAGDCLEKCNRYIVYGPDYADGVILMFWYMKIFLPSARSYMELIIDSETYTIYYLSVEATDDVTYYTDGNGRIVAYDASGGGVELTEEIDAEHIMNTTQSEIIASMAEEMPGGYVSYYRSYYGANGDALSYDEEVKLAESGSVLAENAYTLAVPIEYDGIKSSLFFRFYAETGSGIGPDFAIGIPIIRHLIN